MDLPLGYLPKKDYQWILAKYAGRQKWIDPAFGMELDQKAFYVLVMDPGEDSDEACEFYRCKCPPSQAQDVINILKYFTNGLSKINKPQHVTDLWKEIKQAIKNSEDVAESILSKVSNDAVFNFKCQNPMNMPQFRDKTSFEIVKGHDSLVLSESKIRGAYQLAGYALHKIQGYDPDKIIDDASWQVITQLMINSLTDYEVSSMTQLEDKGYKITKNMQKQIRDLRYGRRTA